MSRGGFSKERPERVSSVMQVYVERGELPGLVWMVSRRGEVHAGAIGTQAIGGDVDLGMSAFQAIDD